MFLITQAFTECTGYRIGQVRIIFKAHLDVAQSSHPLYNRPLAYVQWFKEIAKEDTQINMYLTARSLDEDSNRRGEVIELEAIKRRIQLVPRYGDSVPLDMDDNNSAEDDERYYMINSFHSKETYQSVW